MHIHMYTLATLAHKQTQSHTQSPIKMFDTGVVKLFFSTHTHSHSPHKHAEDDVSVKETHTPTNTSTHIQHTVMCVLFVKPSFSAVWAHRMCACVCQKFVSQFSLKDVTTARSKAPFKVFRHTLMYVCGCVCACMHISVYMCVCD